MENTTRLPFTTTFEIVRGAPPPVRVKALAGGTESGSNASP